MEILDINKIGTPGINKTVIRDKNYFEPLLIRAQSENEALSSSIKDLHLSFEDCTFYNNVFYDIDLISLKINELKISFSNCFILGAYGVVKNHLKTKPELKLSLFFYNCILESINLDNIELNSLSIYNSIVQRNHLSINESQVESIQIYNLLGKYGIHRTKNSNTYIGFGDDNLKIPSKKISTHLKQLGAKYSSIFAFPTEISISDPSTISFESKISTKTGFKMCFSPLNSRT